MKTVSKLKASKFLFSKNSDSNVTAPSYIIYTQEDRVERQIACCTTKHTTVL